MHTRRSIIVLLLLSACAPVAVGSSAQAWNGEPETRVAERSRSEPVQGTDGHLAIQLDIEFGITDHLATIKDDFHRVLRRARIAHLGLTVAGDRIVFELANAEESSAVTRLLAESWPELTVAHETGSFEVFFAGPELTAVRRDILQQALNAVRAYFTGFGMDSGSIHARGHDCILAPPPAADIVERYKGVQFWRSGPTLRLIDTTFDPNGQNLPRGVEILESRDSMKGRKPLRYAVRKRIVLQTNHVVEAVVRMESGRPVVLARFDVLGRRYLRERLPRPDQLLALVLDDRVVAATRVESRRLDLVAFHGDFALAQAEELAAVLRASSNFTPVKIVDICPE